jgi:Planctomycete cytochrome C
VRPIIELIVAGLLALAPLACSGDDGPGCVKDLDLTCQPQDDPPTFDAIYDTTLMPTCGSGQSTCHSPDGHQGGIVFADPDTSYAYLMGQVDGKARVVPGDPACSPLIERLESDDRSFRMPPSTDKLPEPERCTVRLWIENGATR